MNRHEHPQLPDSLSQEVETEKVLLMTDIFFRGLGIQSKTAELMYLEVPRGDLTLQELEQRLLSLTEQLGSHSMFVTSVWNDRHKGLFRMPVSHFLESLQTNFNRQKVLQDTIGAVTPALNTVFTKRLDEIEAMDSIQAATLLQQLRVSTHMIGHGFAFDTLLPLFTEAYNEIPHHIDLSNNPELVTLLINNLAYLAESSGYYAMAYTDEELIDATTISLMVYFNDLRGVLSENSSLAIQILNKLHERIMTDSATGYTWMQAMELLLANKNEVKRFLWEELRRGVNGFLSGLLSDPRTDILVTISETGSLTLTLSEEIKELRRQQIKEHKEGWHHLVYCLTKLQEEFPDAYLVLQNNALHQLSPQALCPVKDPAAYEIQIDVIFAVMELVVKFLNVPSDSE